MLPQEFTDRVKEAINQYEAGSRYDVSSSQFESESERSSPHFLETSHANWTANLTGSTTDRSSTYSTVTNDVSIVSHTHSILITLAIIIIIVIILFNLLVLAGF